MNEMSITVYVWPNHKNPFKITGHPGHASLECKSSMNNMYISWWPPHSWTISDKEDETNKEKGVFSYTPKSLQHDAYKELGARGREGLIEGKYMPKLGQRTFKGVGRGDTPRDLKFSGLNAQEKMVEYDLWVQMPNNVVTIPEYNEGYTNWPANVPKIIGLNSESIKEWWNDFSRKGVPGAPGFFAMDNTYDFYSRDLNCCSVVGRALDYGGAKLFFNRSYSENRTWFYNTPLSVYDYAVNLNKRITEYREFILKLNNTPFLKGGKEIWPEPENDDAELPTVKEWLADSQVKHTFMTARRIEQILAIDKELTLYWDTKNKATTVNNEKMDSELMSSCFKMLKYVKEHVTIKPTSDRRNAVLRLGKRIVNRISELQFFW